MTGGTVVDGPSPAGWSTGAVVAGAVVARRLLVVPRARRAPAATAAAATPARHDGSGDAAAEANPAGSDGIDRRRTGRGDRGGGEVLAVLLAGHDHRRVLGRVRAVPAPCTST